MKKFMIFIYMLIPFFIFSTSSNVVVNTNSNINSFSPGAAFAINTGEWDGFTNLKKNVWQFQHAGFRYLRFPGGSNSNEYHWNGNGYYDADGIWHVTGSPAPTTFSRGFLNLSKYRGSTSAGYRKKAMVTDNDLNTSWKSFSGDTGKQYIILEIQNSNYQPVNVNRIVINWGTPYATQYRIQYSNANWPGSGGIWVYNDTAWTDTSAGLISGSGGVVDLSFNTVSAKYIRVLCEASSSSDNQFEIKEIKLYFGATQVSVNSNDSMLQTKTYSSSVALGDVFDRFGNMDFEQFMDVCRSLTPPAEPLITVNFFTGTTQEAADWVYYANIHKGYNIKYWEIGNENSGNWESGGPVDSEFYAKRFIEFYDAMTTVDPNIVVIPQFNSIGDYENVTMNASNNPVAYDYYIENFLKYLQAQGRVDIIKAISIHRYPTYQPATESIVLSNTDIWNNEMTPLTNWINTYCPNPQSVSTWLTEYNDGIDSAFTNRYYNSLFISAYILNYIKNGGDFGFLFTDFGTPGPGQFAPDIYSDFGAIEGGALSGEYMIYRYQPRSSYWALWMLKNRFSAADELGNTLVVCSSSNSYLKVYANKRGDRKLSLILINTNQTEAIDANITINNFSPLAFAQVTTFSPQHYSWVNNGAQSYANPDLQPSDSIISNASTNFTFNVPAYNIKIITLYDSQQPTLTPSSTPTALPTATFTSTPIFYGTNLLDDCEDGDNIDLWGGGWSIYGDGVSNYPAMFTSMKCDGNGASNSNCYAEITGTVTGNSWGFGVSVPLSSNWSPVDMRSYDGVFFWYKGDGNHKARVYLNQNNIPCYDYFGVDFQTNTYWTFYQFSFSQLTQGGWGGCGGTWTADNIQAVSFQVEWGNVTYTAYMGMDNIGFYKNTPVPSITPTPWTTIAVTDNLDKVYAYPALYTGKDGQDGIGFYNLPEYIKLQIFNINGELVFQKEETKTNGSIIWKVDGRRKDEKISPGIYIYILWDGKNKKTGKIAVVR